MYKLFEEKKEELQKVNIKKYKQFYKEKLNHAESQKNNDFLTEKEKELLQVFNIFNIKILINK